MNLAVIPARGGSKRIPGKNVKEFFGKPIIAWSIEAALNAEVFDKVIVSTDDESIASVSRSYGAEVPFKRPAEISDDFTGTNTVVRHAIKWFEEQGQPVKNACCIYATAPFVSYEDLKIGYNKLIESGKSFAFSLTTFPSPIQRGVRINEDGEVEAIWPENMVKRSQDLEEVYHDAGQFYWGKASAFVDDLPMFFRESVPVLLPRYRVQDIDTLEDWVRAEMMAGALLKK